METIIRMLPEFDHRAKAIAKKYKSFVQDYKLFIESLKTAPKQGKSLVEGCIKYEFLFHPKQRVKAAEPA